MQLSIRLRRCWGDGEAAERLCAVLSWMDMLRVAGDDGQVGELFVAFARDDRAVSRLRAS